MVKTSMSFTKYIIKGEFMAQGYIDKPDLIGAFFGQTEGLIGEELEFQNLQKTGKIGRIDINLKKNNSITKGTFKIPTSLDKIEVSLVAAAIESINKIGHTTGSIKIINIKDEREDKRKIVIKRAEEFLLKLKEDLPDSTNISLNINENISKKSIKKYFKDYYGGPNINENKEIILVEGRADVLNLLKNGFSNVLSFNGSNKLNKKFIELVKNKEITLFLDDDAAGKKEAKVLKDLFNINSVAFALNGKEVEELSYKEIIKCIKNKKSIKNDSKDIYSMDKIKEIIVDKLKDEFIKKQDEYKPKINHLKKEIVEEFDEKQEKYGPKLNDLKSKIIKKGEKIIKNISNKEISVEDSNYFSKEQFDKIEYLIKKVKDKNNFVVLNNNFRQIKVGNNSELSLLKTNKGKILILDGVCEKSILKKAKEIGIELIICKSKIKIENNEKIKVKLFSDFN